jgi:hypothetical protein
LYSEPRLGTIDLAKDKEHSLQEPPILTSVESEISELESVAASLARTPRLEQLLRYLAHKYFEGETDQLTEYNIATEVFGRRKTNFIASEDAIARVETHRLRKRLRAFYETEGKDHPIQIVIPPGTYVPAFAPHKVEPYTLVEPVGRVEALDSNETAGQLPQNGEVLPGTKEAGPRPPEQYGYRTSPFESKRRVWLSILLATLAVVALFGVYHVSRLRHVATANASEQNAAQGLRAAEILAPQGPPTSATVQFPPVALPLRMIAGYTGPPQRDSAGDIWQADQYVVDGWPVQQPAIFIARTSDPMIYRYGRAGDSSYNIPLRPGLYELHLHFLQASETAESEDVENQTAFNVTINGELVLDNFDVVSDAMGRNVADERVFRDVSPAQDGMLHVHLSTRLGTPLLSAIQVLAGTPHKQLPTRVVTQPSSFTDHNGQLWHPDNYFLNGRHLSHNLPIAVTSDPDVLSAERYGHFTYAFPVDTRDQYTVVLYFVELYFGTKASMQGENGSRVFRVTCNGNTLVDNFNIYKEAGDYHVLKKTFYHLKPTAQGKLNLTFEPVSNFATVSAIEILDESK